MKIYWGGGITLTNNLLANVPGTALDAVQGKELAEKIIYADSTYSRGNIEMLTDINQINSSYKFWKIESIDADYAKAIRIERNTGDFHALILSYNGGDRFNYGSFILSSPRLNGQFYYVYVWNNIAYAYEYGTKKGSIGYLNGWRWTSGSGISKQNGTVTLCLGVINERSVYAAKSEIFRIPSEYAPTTWTMCNVIVDGTLTNQLLIGIDGIVKIEKEFEGHYILVNASWAV